MKKALQALPLFLALFCLGAGEKTDWKSCPLDRELKGDTPPAGGFASITLGDGYWAKDGGGLAGLRINNGKGEEVPYFIRVERKEESSRQFPAKLLENLVTDETSGIRVINKILINDGTLAVADLGKSCLINRINLDSPNENFARKVIVEGSEDRTHWRTLLADGFIFDVSGTRNPARKDYLSFPDSNVRYLLVNIKRNSQIGAFILNKLSVQAYSPQWGQSEERDFPGTPVKSENGETTWLFDRERASLPLNEVDFDFESRDFYRPARVELSDDQKSWSSLSICGFLYDAQKGGVENQWKLSGPETTGRYVRITVTNGNDKPLAVHRITLKRWRRTLLFRPTGPGPFRLYYGNSKGQEPSYDLASWAARTAYQETEWTAGDEMPNPDYVPPFVPWTEKPGFIWSLLALVAGILGWMLWSSFKKLMAAPRR